MKKIILSFIFILTIQITTFGQFIRPYYFRPEIQGPLDARYTVATTNDLISSFILTGSLTGNQKGYSYKGMVVSITDTGELYILTNNDPSTMDNWKKLAPTEVDYNEIANNVIIPKPNMNIGPQVGNLSGNLIDIAGTTAYSHYIKQSSSFTINNSFEYIYQYYLAATENPLLLGYNLFKSRIDLESIEELNTLSIIWDPEPLEILVNTTETPNNFDTPLLNYLNTLWENYDDTNYLAPASFNKILNASSYFMVIQCYRPTKISQSRDYIQNYNVFGIITERADNFSEIKIDNIVRLDPIAYDLADSFFELNENWHARIDPNSYTFGEGSTFTNTFTSKPNTWFWFRPPWGEDEPSYDWGSVDHGNALSNAFDHDSYYFYYRENSARQVYDIRHGLNAHALTTYEYSDLDNHAWIIGVNVKVGAGPWRDSHIEQGSMWANILTLYNHNDLASENYSFFTNNLLFDTITENDINKKHPVIMFQSAGAKDGFTYNPNDWGQYDITDYSRIVLKLGSYPQGWQCLENRTEIGSDTEKLWHTGSSPDIPKKPYSLDVITAQAGSAFTLMSFNIHYNNNNLYWYSSLYGHSISGENRYSSTGKYDGIYFIGLSPVGYIGGQNLQLTDIITSINNGTALANFNPANNAIIKPFNTNTHPYNYNFFRLPDQNPPPIGHTRNHFYKNYSLEFLGENIAQNILIGQNLGYSGSQNQHDFINIIDNVDFITPLTNELHFPEGGLIESVKHVARRPTRFSEMVWDLYKKQPIILPITKFIGDTNDIPYTVNSKYTNILAIIYYGIRGEGNSTMQLLRYDEDNDFKPLLNDLPGIQSNMVFEINPHYINELPFDCCSTLIFVDHEGNNINDLSNDAKKRLAINFFEHGMTFNLDGGGPRNYRENISSQVFPCGTFHMYVYENLTNNSAIYNVSAVLKNKNENIYPTLKFKRINNITMPSGINSYEMLLSDYTISYPIRGVEYHGWAQGAFNIARIGSTNSNNWICTAVVYTDTNAVKTAPADINLNNPNPPNYYMIKNIYNGTSWSGWNFITNNLGDKHILAQTRPNNIILPYDHHSINPNSYIWNHMPKKPGILFWPDEKPDYWVWDGTSDYLDPPVFDWGTEQYYNALTNKYNMSPSPRFRFKPDLNFITNGIPPNWKWHAEPGAQYPNELSIPTNTTEYTAWTNTLRIRWDTRPRAYYYYDDSIVPYYRQFWRDYSSKATWLVRRYNKFTIPLPSGKQGLVVSLDGSHSAEYPGEIIVINPSNNNIDYSILFDVRDQWFTRHSFTYFNSFMGFNRAFPYFRPIGPFNPVWSASRGNSLYWGNLTPPENIPFSNNTISNEIILGYSDIIMADGTTNSFLKSAAKTNLNKSALNRNRWYYHNVDSVDIENISLRTLALNLQSENQLTFTFPKGLIIGGYYFTNTELSNEEIDVGQTIFVPLPSADAGTKTYFAYIRNPGSSPDASNLRINFSEDKLSDTHIRKLLCSFEINADGIDYNTLELFVELYIN